MHLLEHKFQFSKYLDDHVNWREETCGIVELHPTTTPDLFDLVRSCFLNEIKKNFEVAVKVLNELDRDIFKEVDIDFRDCPRTNLDLLRDCVREVAR